MPDCLIFTRECFTSHDPTPRGLRGWLARRVPAVRAVWSPKAANTMWTGEAWFLKYWPLLSQNVGADVYVFTNEWFSNRQSHEDVDSFIRFFDQLIDAAEKYGALWGFKIRVTVGDFSVGTPGFPTIPAERYDVQAMQALMDKCAWLGHYWNMHLYDLHFGVDLVDRRYTIQRPDAVLAGHPTIQSVAGELANDGLDVGHKDGLFGGEQSLAFMRVFSTMVKKGCWWLLCDPAPYRDIPEARWDLDDISPILPAYFEWVLSSVHP